MASRSRTVVEPTSWGGASGTGVPVAEGLKAFKLNNGAVEVIVLTYGATLVSCKVPSSRGPAEEVTLCYDSLEQLRSKSPYYGSTVGRVANRIANGTFALDGTEARLATNNGPNHLHGGVKGWDKVFWAARPYDLEDGSAGVEFSYSSAAGEEGYPGAVDATADYRLTPDNEVVMSFIAKVEGDATPIAMCNHTYWNLSGQLRRSIKEHYLQLACSHYLPVDATLIPTGEIAPVAGTPFDFTSEKLVGQDLAEVDGGGEDGYDHCLCRAGPGGVPPEGLGLGAVAILRDAESGRKMTVTTTAPAVQLYTGNFLSKDAADAPHVQHNAMCLETEGYPDAINRPELFPSPVLRPGETYRHVAIHKFEW